MDSPAIILVRPQLGANIGMVARAMANFSLADLRLVSPRDGWPNPDAGPPAAGADHILADATVYDDIAGALHDCVLTFATTVRPRELSKPVVSPRVAAARVRQAQGQGMRAGILFGPERSGLTADDLAAVQSIITCPVDAGFGSLNLAQAVLLVAYEYFQAGVPAENGTRQHIARAPHAEVAGLIAHVEDELEQAGYFHVPARAPASKRTLAHLFSRPDFTSEEVRTLRGVVRALAQERKRRRT